MTYTCRDAALNSATETRTVTVSDETDPVITLNGESRLPCRRILPTRIRELRAGTRSTAT